MTYAVLLTGSRGGFLSLVIVATACLWEFGIRGRRPYLLGFAFVAGLLLWQFAGGMLASRIMGTLNVDGDSAAAYESSQARQQLFWRSIEVTEQHPIFGVGPGNFDQVSGQWHTTHNSLTLLSSEGGIPAFMLYVFILASGFMNLRAAKHLTRPRSESRLLAGALFASLAGYSIGALFLSTAYAYFPYILVAYTIALLSIARKSAVKEREREQAQPATLEWQQRLQAPESDIPISQPI
jgi:O-antigen ligase